MNPNQKKKKQSTILRRAPSKRTRNQSLDKKWNNKSLEPKVWRKIFGFLSVDDLGHVACVCIDWKELVNDEVWQQAFEVRWPIAAKKLQSKIKKINKSITTDQKGWREYYRVYHTTKRKSFTRSISAQSKKKPSRTISQDFTANGPLDDDFPRTKSQDLRPRGVSFSSHLMHSTPSLYPSGAGGEEEIHKAILQWLSVSLKKYYHFCPVYDLPSFATGEPFMALLHKFDPTLIDLETFDRSDPIRTLSVVFTLAEQHIGIPALLDPYAVANNMAQRSLLLYLTLWREKTLGGTPNPLHWTQNDFTYLYNAIEDALYNVEQLNVENREHSVHLLSAVRPYDKERHADEEGAKLFHDFIHHAMDTMSAMETKNTLLQKQNLLLKKKLEMIQECKNLEENARKKDEQQLALEEKIKAIGEVLTERGISDILSLKG